MLLPSEYHASRYGENSVLKVDVRKTCTVPLDGAALVLDVVDELVAPVLAVKPEAPLRLEPQSPVVWSLSELVY